MFTYVKIPELQSVPTTLRLVQEALLLAAPRPSFLSVAELPQSPTHRKLLKITLQHARIATMRVSYKLLMTIVSLLAEFAISELSTNAS